MWVVSVEKAPVTLQAVGRFTGVVGRKLAVVVLQTAEGSLGSSNRANEFVST
jgi:hypothetical protein